MRAVLLIPCEAILYVLAGLMGVTASGLRWAAQKTLDFAEYVEDVRRGG